MWDVFMDQFEVLASQAPVMLVAGNHERDFPGSGDRYGTNIDSGMAACILSLILQYVMALQVVIPGLLAVRVIRESFNLCIAHTTKDSQRQNMHGMAALTILRLILHMSWRCK